MDSIIFGYLLNENILFEVASRKLVQYKSENTKQPFCFKVTVLNETQSRLLIFLLENSQIGIIDKDDVMKNVWDNFSLSSSSQRLWQTVNDVRKILSCFDLSDDFIKNIHGSGYVIDNTKVAVLYMR